MEPFGELLPGAIRLANKDFAAVEGDRQAAVIKEGEAADLIVA